MNTLFKFLLLSWLAFQPAIAMQNHSIQAIQEDVDRYVRANLEVNADYRIQIAPIDPHLQLPACEQTLTLSAQSGNLKPGLNTISVRCNGDRNWAIFSTVVIKAFQQVLVSSKPIQRNEPIRAEHLTLEKRDVGSLQQGFLSDPEDAVNKQASRNIAAGTVLNRNHYAELTLIKRGEQISIQSGRGGLLISAPGIALMNGAKGQQIRVKNASSQRIVQAVVTDAGVVSVAF